MGVLYAYHLPSRPPARSHPVVQICRHDGVPITELSMLAAPHGPSGWDLMLDQLGYTRITPWRPMKRGARAAPASYVCAVAPAGAVAINGLAPAHQSTGLLAPCTASTILRPEHAGVLEWMEIPGAAGDEVTCRYAARHPLPHVGLGRVSPLDQGWRWLLWEGSLVRLIRLAALCEATSPGAGPDVDRAACTLPLGHPPGHSWQLRTAAV